MPNESQSPAGVPMDDLALELAEASVTSPTVETKVETQIPDKYRDKSVEDLINMHQNAEKRMSQMGNELGEVRRLADQLIGVKATENTRKVQEPRKPVTVDALLADPDQVLNSTLESSSVAQRQALQDQRLQRLELSVEERAFTSHYPNFKQDMENPQFLDWVNKNPLRQNLAGAAYQNKDYTAATNLWSLWEEHKEVAGVTQQASKNVKLNSAKTLKGGNAEGAPPKTYSRAKLMELRAKVADGDESAIARWNDEGFQARLVEAYQQGLVK